MLLPHPRTFTGVRRRLSTFTIIKLQVRSMIKNVVLRLFEDGVCSNREYFFSKQTNFAAAFFEETRNTFNLESVLSNLDLTNLSENLKERNNRYIFFIYTCMPLSKTHDFVR